MSLNREEKQAVVDEVKSWAKKAQTLVLAEYRGISVADMTRLRNDARSKNVKLSVLKNTLARQGVTGTTFESATSYMVGPLLYGFSEDAVAAAKVLADFGKSNEKLVLKGGVYGGQFLDANEIKSLASIPTKEVLLGQLCGLLKSPISRTAVVLAALSAKKEAATVS